MTKQRKKRGKPAKARARAKKPLKEAKPKVLSAKQQAFVREYLIDLNATAAYKRAGYKDTPAAHHNADRLMAKDNIQAAIQEGIQARAQRLDISADHVVEELARLAFVDIGQVLDFSGSDVKLRPAHTVPENARRALASMKVKRYLEGHGDDAKDVEVTEFKLWEKLPALVKLGQHLGLFPTKIEHTGANGGAIPIQIVGVEIVEPKEPTNDSAV